MWISRRDETRDSHRDTEQTVAANVEVRPSSSGCTTDKLVQPTDRQLWEHTNLRACMNSHMHAHKQRAALQCLFFLIRAMAFLLSLQRRERSGTGIEVTQGLPTLEH